ncbi:MAG: HU family DNA-binding protein [Tannerellaceae bacterium]|nr:HU family DNA-binding protein [Tannerellaceae bacterium]
MKYRVIERINPGDKNAPKKQYASPVNAGKLTIKDLSAEIAGRSSLTRGDIENVLSNFLEQLPTFLKLGLSVQLGNFGTMRLNLQSEGVEQGKKFTGANITGVKLIFTPSVELKDSLADTPFEEVKITSPAAAPDENYAEGEL